MNDTTTMHTGPLGSTIHVLRADAEVIARIADFDWSRKFRRVCLDPVRGLIVLMAPSRAHESLTDILDDIVKTAGSLLTGAVAALRHTRLRGPDEPPGTGMEADCAFYIGERARGYYVALDEGSVAADAYVERTAPDLVVEVEITHADEGRIERYRDLGVRELWRLQGRMDSWEIRAEFLALGAGAEPRPLEASEVLGSLTPDDACEMVGKVRHSRTPDARIEAVTRIVRRRQRESLRVREAPPPCVPSGEEEASFPAGSESVGGDADEAAGERLHEHTRPDASDAPVLS